MQCASVVSIVRTRAGQNTLKCIRRVLVTNAVVGAAVVNGVERDRGLHSGAQDFKMSRVSLPPAAGRRDRRVVDVEGGGEQSL